MVDITGLTTSLLTVSAITKVATDMIKLNAPKVAENPKVKYFTSAGIATLLTVADGISLLPDVSGKAFFYAGCVGAGLVASLGANFIHEAIQVLSAVKSFKKDDAVNSVSEIADAVQPVINDVEQVVQEIKAPVVGTVVVDPTPAPVVPAPEQPAPQAPTQSI